MGPYSGLPRSIYLDTLDESNIFVFWAIPKISKPTTISSDCSNKFLTMLTLLGTSRDPWAVEVVPRGTYLDTFANPL